MQLKYSCGFLKGCRDGVLTLSQGAFQCLLFFSPQRLSVPGHAPSVVKSQFWTFDTPCLSMHICAKRSSPMGPHLVPFTQSIDWAHSSRLLRSALKAWMDQTSRFPKSPHCTSLQFSKYTPVAVRGWPSNVFLRRCGTKTASASTFTIQSERLGPSRNPTALQACLNKPVLIQPLELSFLLTRWKSLSTSSNLIVW